jgi:hypothetical protein
MKLYTLFLILAAAALGHAANVDPVAAAAPPDEIRDSIESVDNVDPMELPVEPLGGGQMGGLRELVRGTECGERTLCASLSGVKQCSNVIRFRRRFRGITMVARDTTTEERAARDTTTEEREAKVERVERGARVERDVIATAMMTLRPTRHIGTTAQESLYVMAPLHA